VTSSSVLFTQTCTHIDQLRYLVDVLSGRTRAARYVSSAHIPIANGYRLLWWIFLCLVEGCYSETISRLSTCNLMPTFVTRCHLTNNWGSLSNESPNAPRLVNTIFLLWNGCLVLMQFLSLFLVNWDANQSYKSL
jgi:hypothetical protein